VRKTMVRCCRWGWLALVLSALGLAWMAARSLAAEKAVTVLRRDGAFVIQTDGRVRARETWEVDFQGGPFRYAYRTFALHRVEDIVDIRVGEPGRPYQRSAEPLPGTYQVIREGDTLTVRWFFDPVTDESRTFVLEYTLVGALWIHPDGDQFYWTFIEADRGYTIQAAQVQVLLPAAFSPQDVLLATYGSSGAGRAQLQDDGRTVLFEGGPFPPGTSWVLRVQWPHGYVQAEPPAWQQTEMWRPYLVLGGSVLFLLAGLSLVLGAIIIWYVRGRDPAAITVPRVTKPPTDDPPGVVGVLIDETGSHRETVATLLDLARRGHIRFEQKNGELTLVRQSSSQPLQPFESRFLARLFGPRPVIRQRDFARYLPPAHRQLISDLYEEVRRRGYFRFRPDRVRFFAFLIGFFVLAVYMLGLVLFLLWAFPDSGVLLCLSFGLGLLGLAGVALWAKAMPRRTAKGARVAALWEGFKRYLRTLDNWRNLKPEDAAKTFDAYLPYATALGLENTWIRIFASQPSVPAPPWWGPARPYDTPGRGSIGREPRPQQAGWPTPRPAPSPNIPRPSGGSLWGGMDQMADRAFVGLDSISTSLLGALNTVAAHTRPPSSSSRGGGGWSGGGFGGGGAGGGGSSGFG